MALVATGARALCSGRPGWRARPSRLPLGRRGAHRLRGAAERRAVAPTRSSPRPTAPSLAALLRRPRPDPPLRGRDDAPCRSTSAAAARTPARRARGAGRVLAVGRRRARWSRSPTRSTAARRRSAATEAAGADCSGERAGNLYLQYWFYYPGSATGRGEHAAEAARSGRRARRSGRPTLPPGRLGELQVRIGPDGRASRAPAPTSGYGYELGGVDPDPRPRAAHRAGGAVVLRRRAPVVNGWGPDLGTLYVSGGSHAGSARVDRDVGRATTGHRLRLVPLRAIAQHDGTAFAVTPPWRKGVSRTRSTPGPD